MLEKWETDYFDRSRVVAVAKDADGRGYAQLIFDGGARVPVDKSVEDAVAWVNGREEESADISPGEATIIGASLAGVGISCRSDGLTYSVQIYCATLQRAQELHRTLVTLRDGYTGRKGE